MNGNVLFEIKDLQKKFGSLTVFDGLSETICKGDVVVIMVMPYPRPTTPSMLHRFPGNIQL